MSHHEGCVCFFFFNYYVFYIVLSCFSMFQHSKLRIRPIKPSISNKLRLAVQNFGSKASNKRHCDLGFKHAPLLLGQGPLDQTVWICHFLESNHNCKLSTRCNLISIYEFICLIILGLQRWSRPVEQPIPKCRLAKGG